MDIYGSDRKLSELGDRDLGLHDFLDHDLFSIAHGSATHGFMDFSLDGSSDVNNWLNSYFDPVFVSDLMDEPQHVKSEHSYSLSKGCLPLDLTFEVKIEMDKDSDNDLLGTIHPNSTKSLSYNDQPSCLYFSSCKAKSNSDSYGVNQMIEYSNDRSNEREEEEEALLEVYDIKSEPFDVNECEIDPKPNSLYDINDLPLTPPISSPSSSDSEGSQSPIESSPSSPQPKHDLPLRQTQHLQWTSTLAQPTCFFTNPIPSSGILILTEEEKRTLISEGYPLPTKLPLTKQEEKNLKKIRRKIKNKISAQESRRKKKEYLESLEKKVELMSQENSSLKKKLDLLENNNRSLTSELQKLQSVANKVSRVSSSIGTCLLVN